MASLAAFVQIVTSLLYLWLNRIESKVCNLFQPHSSFSALIFFSVFQMLERCWPQNKSSDDADASSINTTADESTSLLSGFSRVRANLNLF
jgi:hypothetical protein